MRTSVVNHPSNEPMIIVRKWQLAATDGNGCAAALLSMFEYFHTVRMEIAEHRENLDVNDKRYVQLSEEMMFLQYYTEAQLEERVMLYKRGTIRKGLDLLVEKGFVTIHRNPNPRYNFDRTRHFMFHPEAVNAWLETYSANEHTNTGTENDTDTSVDSASSKTQDDFLFTQNDTGGDSQTDLDHSKTILPSFKNEGPIPETTTETTNRDNVQREFVNELEVDRIKMSEVEKSTSSDVIFESSENSTAKSRITNTHYELAQLLDSHVTINSPKQKRRTPTDLARWANTIRLMQEQDGHDPAEIRQVIEWAHGNEFWCVNIRSADKLRKQFARLWDQMQVEQGNNKKFKPKFEPSPGGYGIDNAVAFAKEKQRKFRERMERQRTERESLSDNNQDYSMQLQRVKELF